MQKQNNIQYTFRVFSRKKLVVSHFSKLFCLKWICLGNAKWLHDPRSEHPKFSYICIKVQFCAKINFYFFYTQPHMIWWWPDFVYCVLFTIFHVTKYQTNQQDFFHFLVASLRRNNTFLRNFAQHYCSPNDKCVFPRIAILRNNDTV